MDEFCITCARILWNVNKDVLDLLIYPGMLVSIYQYLLVLLSSFWCLPFLFLAVEASAVKRSEAALNYIVFQVCLAWEQLWQSRVRLVLITSHVGKCEEVC